MVHTIALVYAILRFVETICCPAALARRPRAIDEPAGVRAVGAGTTINSPPALAIFATAL